MSGFERARLRIARELLGLSQAQLAAGTGVSPAAISQYEGGATKPGADTIANLSATLQIPASFFAEPLTETHEGFFRSLRRTTIADRRRARAVAHIAHDLALNAAMGGQLAASHVPEIAVSGLAAPRDEIENIAAQVRYRWNVPPGPISNVVDLLEEHGIVVIRLPLGSTDVDAFSVPFSDHPVVVLSTAKNDRARSRFDAAHELGHFVLHGDQIWGVKEVETQAQQFAAAFLMPEDEIREHLPETADWTTLFRLKEAWHVSLAALLMRARTLGRMTENTYLNAVKAASARGWRRVEPVPLGEPELPRRLISFLESPKSGDVRARLPATVLDEILVAMRSHDLP